MSRFRATVAALLAAFAAWLVWSTFRSAAETHRFRLVIEADAGGALRSGASVIEVRTIDSGKGWLPEAGGLHSYVSGEAVFVDLGNGKNVTAILGFGPTGNEDRVSGLTLAAFRPSHPGLTFKDIPRLAGTAPLTGNLIPTLVTFADLKDPKTARVVAPDEFEQVFGEGVRFKRAFVEMVPHGWWPFTALGWPRSLAGEPVTREIEKKITWWGGPGSPVDVAYRSWRGGNTTGPSIERETLFKRN
jgi:hypothetical protein